VWTKFHKTILTTNNKKDKGEEEIKINKIKEKNP
jgi:hypothetical protein